MRKAGFRPKRQKGSHVTWEHERFPSIAVVLAIQDGEDADPYEERELRRAIALVRFKDTQEGAMSQNETEMTEADFAAVRPYAMVIEWSDPDQKFIVTVPDLRGCRTAGVTREEAARNGEEAIASMLAAFADSGVQIPTPRFTALDEVASAGAARRSA